MDGHFICFAGDHHDKNDKGNPVYRTGRPASRLCSSRRSGWGAAPDSAEAELVLRRLGWQLRAPEQPGAGRWLCQLSGSRPPAAPRGVPELCRVPPSTPDPAISERQKQLATSSASATR